MRYYGPTFKESYLSSVETVKDSVMNTTYGVDIAGVHLDTDDVTYIRDDCANVGFAASRRVTDIRDVFDTYKTLVGQLYDDLEDNADEIYMMAVDAKMTAASLQNTLINLTHVLNGTGRYSGKTVSAEDVAEATKPLSSAEKWMKEAYTRYFTNPDGSLDENTVERYFENTDNMIANGQENTFQTDTFVEIINKYLEDNEYSESAYADLMNVLIKGGTVYQDTSGYNWPEHGVEVGDEYGSVFTMYYAYRKSYYYLLNSAYTKFAEEYSNIDGSYGNFDEKLALYDSLYALSSTGSIAFKSFIDEDEMEKLRGDENELYKYARSKAVPNFSVKFAESDGKKHLEISNSGNGKGGFPQGLYLSNYDELYYSTGTKIDSLNVYSLCPDFNNVIQKWKDDNVETTMGSFKKGFKDVGQDIFIDLVIGFIPGSELLGAGKTAAGALGDNGKVDSFLRDYNSLTERQNFYRNTEATGSYWTLTSNGKDTLAGANTNVFYSQQEAQKYLCYKYYCNPNDTTIEKMGSEASKNTLRNTVGTNNNLSMSVDNYYNQLDDYWQDYCKVNGYSEPPCDFDDLDPSDIEKLAYANRESNQKSGCYYDNNQGYDNDIEHGKSYFNNCNVDISKYAE